MSIDTKYAPSDIQYMITEVCISIANATVQRHTNGNSKCKTCERQSKNLTNYNQSRTSTHTHTNTVLNAARSECDENENKVQRKRTCTT